jgi:hypothetical protein
MVNLVATFGVSGDNHQSVAAPNVTRGRYGKDVLSTPVDVWTSMSAISLGEMEEIEQLYPPEEATTWPLMSATNANRRTSTNQDVTR